MFSICILSRRVIWTLIKKLIGKIMPSNWAQSFIIIIRSLLTFNIIVGLLYTAYVIVQKHHLVNILYLAYPVSLYFVLFGLVGEPFLELLPDLSDTNANSRVKIFQDSNGKCTFFFFNDLFLYLAIDTVFHPSGIFQNGMEISSKSRV